MVRSPVLISSLEVLNRTPLVLTHLLSGLSEGWLNNNEGENTWCPLDILGHLIHGEKTAWMIRTKIIMSDAENKTFEPFDRFTQMNEAKEKTIEELLIELQSLREKNLTELKQLEIQESYFSKKGIHPELGVSKPNQLLATWVGHDLGHISQISRVMAKQHKSEVGPWSAYLGVLKGS